MASDADNILVEKQPEAPSASMPWAAFAWFAALLVVCYAPVLLRLVRQWADDPDMGHGFFVPVLAGYIAWQKRGKLLSQAPSPNWWGLLVVAYGALQLFLATLGAELFLARTAFVISLAGVVLVMGGARSLRILAFPLFLLFFMVPIPAIIYSQITFPLQLFASQVAAAALSFARHSGAARRQHPGTGQPASERSRGLQRYSFSAFVVVPLFGLRLLLR